MNTTNGTLVNQFSINLYSNVTKAPAKYHYTSLVNFHAINTVNIHFLRVKLESAQGWIIQPAARGRGMRRQGRGGGKKPQTDTQAQTNTNG